MSEPFLFYLERQSQRSEVNRDETLSGDIRQLGQKGSKTNPAGVFQQRTMMFPQIIFIVHMFIIFSTMDTTLHSVMDKYLAGFRKTCFVRNSPYYDYCM